MSSLTACSISASFALRNSAAASFTLSTVSLIDTAGARWAIFGRQTSRNSLSSGVPVRTGIVEGAAHLLPPQQIAFLLEVAAYQRGVGALGAIVATLDFDDAVRSRRFWIDNRPVEHDTPSHRGLSLGG